MDFTGGAMADTALKTATFAGGCFWCMQGEFDHIDGVSKVMAGYTGGTTRNPTYEQVAHGDTGHVEAIEITYDPKKASYQKLLDIFWEILIRWMSTASSATKAVNTAPVSSTMTTSRRSWRKPRRKK